MILSALFLTHCNDRMLLVCTACSSELQWSSLDSIRLHTSSLQVLPTVDVKCGEWYNVVRAGSNHGRDVLVKRHEILTQCNPKHFNFKADTSNRHG